MAKSRLTQILANLMRRSSKGSVTLSQVEVATLRKAGERQIAEAIRLRRMTEDAWIRAGLVSDTEVANAASEVGNLERLAIAAEQAVPDALWFAHYTERGAIYLNNASQAIKDANGFLLNDFSHLLSDVRVGPNKIEALKRLEQAYHRLGEFTTEAYNQGNIVLDAAKKAAEKAEKIAAHSGASEAAKNASAAAQVALQEAQGYVIALYEAEKAMAKLGESITDLTKLHELPVNYEHLFDAVIDVRDRGIKAKAAWERAGLAAENQANLAVQSTGTLVAFGQMINTGPGDFMEKVQEGELPQPAEFVGAATQVVGDPSTLLEVPCVAIPGCIDMKREADAKVGEAIVGAYDVIVGNGEAGVVKATAERAKIAWESAEKPGQSTPATQLSSNVSLGL